jgi:hypothetical protein
LFNYFCRIREQRKQIFAHQSSILSIFSRLIFLKSTVLGLDVAKMPARIRLMVVALTLYFWKVPLSRLGLWLGVSKRTGSQWVSGLAVAIFPTIQAWIALRVGVGRWLRTHATALSEATVARVTRLMKRVVQTRDPRTVRRRLDRLTAQDARHRWGLGDWLRLTRDRLGGLLPAVRRNPYPRTTNAIERFFRAFQRFYKTRGGFHSVISAKRELLLFIVVSVFTKQAGTGIAPIERIVPQASQMPLDKLVNDPFTYGLANICQGKRNGVGKMAPQQASLQLEMP